MMVNILELSQELEMLRKKFSDGNLKLEEIKRLVDIDNIIMGFLLDKNTELLAELQGAKANAMILNSIIENGSNPADKDKIVSLIMENSALKAELARYKQAEEDGRIWVASEELKASIDELFDMEGKDGTVDRTKPKL